MPPDKAAVIAIRYIDRDLVGCRIMEPHGAAQIITRAYLPLVEAASETREAAAALMRAIRDAGCIQQVMALMPDTYNGFGERIDAVLRAVVGEAEGAKR
jgi:hypothetical protein